MADQAGCGHILRERAPPVFDAITQAGDGLGLDHRLLVESHNLLLREWRSENTMLYYILRASIDLTGAMQDNDIQLIRTHFHHDNHRDGRGLYEWVRSFKQQSSLAAQASISAKVEAAELKAPTP